MVLHFRFLIGWDLLGRNFGAKESLKKKTILKIQIDEYRETEWCRKLGFAYRRNAWKYRYVSMLRNLIALRYLPPLREWVMALTLESELVACAPLRAWTSARPWKWIKSVTNRVWLHRPCSPLTGGSVEIDGVFLVTLFALNMFPAIKARLCTTHQKKKKMPALCNLRSNIGLHKYSPPHFAFKLFLIFVVDLIGILYHKYLKNIDVEGKSVEFTTLGTNLKNVKEICISFSYIRHISLCVTIY